MSEKKLVADGVDVLVQCREFLYELDVLELGGKADVDGLSQEVSSMLKVVFPVPPLAEKNEMVRMVCWQHALSSIAKQR